MASHQLTAVGIFPAGTTVGAYLRTNWLSSELPPSGAAKGAATDSQVMGTSSLTFTGLADATAYFAGASVGGTWRYIGFTTAAAAAAGGAASTVDPLEDFDTYAMAIASCQSYYQFREPFTSATTANLVRDSKGTVHGTITSTSSKVFTGAGRGLRYGGLAIAGAAGTDYVSLGDFYDFTGTAAFSLLALIRPSAVASGVSRSLGGKGTAVAGTDQWYMTLSAAGLPAMNRFDVAGANDAVTGTTAVAVGVERLVIATYDATNLRMYVDGVQEGGNVLSSKSIPNAATDNRIGNIALGGTQGFAGEIVRWGIFNAAILQADITELQSRRA